MRTEIIRMDGDLKREVWTFSLYVSSATPCIYFDYYAFETKESSIKRIWKRQTHWGRIDKRNNNIEEPPLPTDVESEMRDYFSKQVSKIELIK